MNGIAGDPYGQSTRNNEDIQAEMKLQVDKVGTSMKDLAKKVKDGT